MTSQEQAAQLTRDAGEALFASARAMPADKLNWSPAGDARTALHMLQECAYYLPTLAPLLSQGDGMVERFTAVAGPAMEESKSWDTLDKVETAYNGYLEATLAAIRAVPDNDLNREVPLPWAEGVTMPVWKMLLSLYWNTVYHVGQINYIQTMYGDQEMHSGM
jgi:hypothetical protein